MKMGIKLHLSTHKLSSWMLLLSCACLCVGLSFFVFQVSANRLAQEEERIALLEMRVNKTIIRHRDHQAHVEKFAKADQQYVSRYLEKIPFLEAERQTLKVIDTQPAFSRGIKLRSVGENHLAFAETQRRSKSGSEEIEYSQMQPVQMSLQDLKTFLQAIEGANPKRPQLLIKDFTLEKEKLFASKEVYSVQCQLIQREIQ